MTPVRRRPISHYSHRSYTDLFCFAELSVFPLPLFAIISAHSLRPKPPPCDATRPLVITASAGNLLRSSDVRGYNSMARMYTRIYATADPARPAN